MIYVMRTYERTRVLCYSYFIKNMFYHTIFLKSYMYDIMNLGMMYTIYIVRTNEWRTYLCCTHNITRHLILGCLKHVIITYGDILLKANDINMTYCIYCLINSHEVKHTRMTKVFKLIL